jgi:hypothetical protein
VIFHDGIAIGIPRRDDRRDADRLADRHRELVAKLGRHGLSVLSPPFTGHEEGHVDRFLDIAARLVQNLSHLARHVARQRFLPVGEKLCGAKEQLGAPGRGHQPPMLVGPLRRLDRPRGVDGSRLLENPDNFVGIGGIAVFEQVA